MTKHEIKTLIDAMEMLTQIPQGGVGDDGATQIEIDDAAQAGCNVENDAVYHAVQSAWLKLRSILPQ